MTEESKDAVLREVKVFAKYLPKNDNRIILLDTLIGAGQTSKGEKITMFTGTGSSILVGFENGTYVSFSMASIASAAVSIVEQNS